MATRIKNTRGATAKTSTDALPADSSGRRAKWGIQNCSTAVLNVHIGNTTINLRACTVQDDGEGGSTEDFGVDVWDGAVTVSGSNIRYNLFEYLR
jgi:hypothetical protein